MPVETQLELLFDVIEGGKAVTGQVVPFPSDVGATALEGITESVELGNGVATEVSQLTAVEGGATTTTGVGILAADVGVVGAAIAPALGIVAGVGLYELAPDFWTNVGNALYNAGQTIGNKVRVFLNGEDKTLGLSEETIEIFKQSFLDAGIYNGTYISEDVESYVESQTYDITTFMSFQQLINYARNLSGQGMSEFVDYVIENLYTPTYPLYCVQFSRSGEYGKIWRINIENPQSFTVSSVQIEEGYLVVSKINGLNVSGHNKAISYDRGRFTFSENEPSFTFINPRYDLEGSIVVGALLNAFNSINLQDDAIYPDDEPFPLTYPTWTPYELPDEQTKVYPLTMPVIDPNPLQEPAQNPEPLPDNDPALLDWLVNNMQLPKPHPALEPAPVPAIDPDPQPTADPIDEPTKPTTGSDPVNPNPEPTTPFLPVVPTLPDSVPANAMFTVYKPTIAQVDAFGGWLWSNSILETIKRIWQNPLDGIIAFMKVYVDAPTSGNDTIKVGVLDSEVSSAVVSGQFVTVECGSIDIEEKFFNATDYSPFVALHLYLPFIGIVELDIDEFMGGSIKVTYHVDVYTGTCLAEVKAKRNHDMDDYTIVYTFSGNASQQLPLTSAEFGGALSALVGVVGGGLAIASGGGLGLLAGASGIAHAVTHEMVHLAHSGSLSANAGIMGARTPYLILTRRRGYDANGYNQIYGYPANKTVYLNNCSGLVRVKDIQLKTGATDLEANEIVSLLKDGVIV